MSTAPLTAQTPTRTGPGALPVPDLPPRPAPDPDYRTRGACAHDPRPDRWIDLPPIRIRGKDNPAYDAAVADLADVCGTCPVRAECLWDALAYDVAGIFGGTDEYQRADLRDRHGLPAPTRLAVTEGEDDERMRDQRFTARRHARHGLSNIEIATVMGVSAMSISRLLDESA